MESNNLINKIKSCIKDNKTDIPNLVEILKNCGLENFNINLKYDEKKYTRNLIFKNNDFQLVIMCWPINFESSIHDHNGSECFFKILKGVMLEKKYEIFGEKLKLTNDNIITESSVSFLENNNDIHQVKNIHNNFVITLHLYVPFYQKTNVYQLKENNKFAKKIIELSFDN